MKTLITLILTIASFHLLAQAGNSLDLLNKGKTKLPLESGKITYNISGDASGEATLYFDRNGWRQVIIKEITFERFGISSTEKTIELTDGDYRFQVNLDSKKGKKITDNRWGKLMGYKEPQEIIEIILEDDGGTFTGDTSLLDYDVAMWTFKKSATPSVWHWNGLNLKETKALGTLTYDMIAISLEEKPVDETVFELPEGVEWTSPN
jgi:hypothetical protein